MRESLPEMPQESIYLNGYDRSPIRNGLFSLCKICNSNGSQKASLLVYMTLSRHFGCDDLHSMNST